MNQKITIRVDQETVDLLNKLKQELKTSKSDIMRMSVMMFSNYVEKVNK